jgi:hypothetical protein
VDQVTVTGNSASDFLVPVTGAIEGLFNGFHGEVGMSPINHFKDANTPMFPKGARLYLKQLC